MKLIGKNGFFPDAAFWWAIGLLATGYALVIYPFAYFRHDDWLILGNSLRLDRDLSFAWSTDLDFGNRVGTWFFRPGFKLLTHLLRHTIGLNYAAWLSLLFLMTAVAIGFGADALRRLHEDSSRGARFAVLFAACVPFHIGSLAWAGEGLMNCPQVMILAFATWAFCRAALEESLTWNLAGTAAFVMALLFKESSIFHSAWLACLVVCEPRLAQLGWRRRFSLLLPITIASAVYVVFRLGYLPFNPEYVPTKTLADWIGPAALLVAFLSLPLFALALTTRPLRAAVAGRWPYLGFVALTIVPYLGHPFFSPGWLLYPGFFSLWAIASCTWSRERKAFARAVGLMFLIGAGLVTAQMVRLGWWQWGEAQRSFTSALKQLPPTTERFIVRRCWNLKYLQSTPERVLGTSEALQFQAQLVLGRPLSIVIAPCKAYVDWRGTPWIGKGAIIVWHFPSLSWELLPAH